MLSKELFLLYPLINDMFNDVYELIKKQYRVNLNDVDRRLQLKNKSISARATSNQTTHVYIVHYFTQKPSNSLKQQQMTENKTSAVEIKGSGKLVSDYFEICIHNLLFQRHIYPKEDFKVVRKFGLNLVFSKDENIIQYVRKIIKQLHKWIFSRKIEWLTMLIVSKETEEISEKWMFHIDVISDTSEDANLDLGSTTLTPIEDIQNGIQTIIRQISASVALLPEFEEPQTFSILVHTIGDIAHSKDWSDAGDMEDLSGENIESVQFNNFKTDVHKVSTFVTYKTRDL